MRSLSKLEVDREFIPAIEAAFGRTMHAVILQDAKLAAEIVANLNENKLGQAALAIPDLVAWQPARSQRFPKARSPGLSIR